MTRKLVDIWSSGYINTVTCDLTLTEALSSDLTRLSFQHNTVTLFNIYLNRFNKMTRQQSITAVSMLFLLMSGGRLVRERPSYSRNKPLQGMRMEKNILLWGDDCNSASSHHYMLLLQITGALLRRCLVR